MPNTFAVVYGNGRAYGMFNTSDEASIWAEDFDKVTPFHIIDVREPPAKAYRYEEIADAGR